MKSKIKDPDFICIGAQKAGTTWLYNNFLKHPDIALPYLKELHFFDEIERGIYRDLYSRLFNNHWMNAWWRHNFKHRIYHSFKEKERHKFFWMLKYFLFPRSFKWYRSLFSQDKDFTTGEFTPDYSLINRELIRELKTNFPEVKIILLLRDPVETAWSHIKMIYLRTQKINSLQSIKEQEIIDFIHSPNPLINYPLILNNWLSEFPEDQVFIGFYDDITNKPTELLSSIYNFLNISIPEENAYANTIYNPGIKDKLKDLYRKELYKKYKADIEYLINRFKNQETNYPKRWKEKYTQGISQQ